MKKIRALIFTEEYAVNIYIGKKDEMLKEVSKYMRCSFDAIKDQFEGNRGMTWDCFPEWHPLIGIDGDMRYDIQLATLAHEASHAMNFIIKKIGIRDETDEFRAHGIASIMREVMRQIVKRKRK